MVLVVVLVAAAVVVNAGGAAARGAAGLSLIVAVEKVRDAGDGGLGSVEFRG